MHYLSSITVNSGKVYALFVKSPARVSWATAGFELPVLPRLGCGQGEHAPPALCESLLPRGAEVVAFPPSVARPAADGDRSWVVCSKGCKGAGKQPVPQACAERKPGIDTPASRPSNAVQMFETDEAALRAIQSSFRTV